MAESHNRTLICSVLFIDIVEYSRKPVVEQIALKDRFNALLSSALRDVAVNDRIILDTGDGAAISFIGDPEDALFVAADLRDVIAKESEAIDLELGTRMGVNLGPVRLVRDINGQPNIIGDGINVAQRVMSFAKPGQILVSRSYYEVVSRLSEESSKIFIYEGSRTDKHIREHEVYGVGDVSALRKRVDEQRSTAEPNDRLGLEPMARNMKGGFERLKARPRTATLLAVGAIVALAIGIRVARDDAEPVPSEAATEAQQAPEHAVVPAAAEVPLKMTERAEPKASAPAGVPKRATERAPAAAAAAEARRASVAAVAEPKRTEPEERRAQPVVAAPDEQPAMLSLAIAPWGQVFVNGKMRGVSPPLQELELPPGRHRIEVRNEGSATHVVSVNAKAGERVRIKHKFQ